MATSFPTASSLGILANGTDQTSALNTALSNANYSGIIFDYSPAAAVTINGTVTATDKVLQFLAGNMLTGTGTITGGYIDADYNAQIWDITNNLLVKPKGTVGKYYSLKWSGAGNAPTYGDWGAIQNDINICVYNGLKELYLPAGFYNISTGLLFRKDHNGQYAGTTLPTPSQSDFLLGMNLTGDGIAYDKTPSGQTIINLTDPTSFAIGLQRVKGFKCRGISFYGMNTVLTSLTPYDVMQNPDPAIWVASGVRDNTLSPHCGANVDPFTPTGASMSNMYPGFEAYYNVETSTGGSTDVTFEDCVFREFFVGRAVSINGGSNNGEIVTFRSCWADYNKVSLATGQSQTRSVICENDHVWGGTMAIYDSRTFGNGTGCPVTSIGLNAAGGIRYLCVLPNWVSNGLIVKNAHIELLWSLGGDFTSPVNSLRIEDSWIDLAGSYPGIGVTQPYSIFNGGTLKISNSYLFQYDASVRQPLSLHCNQAIFENVFFDALPMNNYGSTSFKDCTSISNFGDTSIVGWDLVAEIANEKLLFTTGMKAIFPSFTPAGVLPTTKERKKLTSNYISALVYQSIVRDVVGVPISTSITLTSLSYSTNTAQFSLSPSSVDYNNLLLGDNLIFYTTDEYGNTPVIVAFGQVTALSSGTVTLGGIAKGLNTTSSYSLFIYRNEFLIAPLILGDITSGSNIVLNILIEGGNLLPIGVPVYMPHFPLGTTIVSYNSTAAQLTLSNNATITENNVAIISSNWIGEEVGETPSVTNPYRWGYKKGDRIYNNRTDLYPNITYWECTKNGITSTTSLPEFVAYDATESATYTASAVTAATADSSKVIFLKATSNSITYTIDPVAFHNLTQSIFGIISGTNTITISPSSGTINGAASYPLANNQCIKIYSDGTNLYIIGNS